MYFSETKQLCYDMNINLPIKVLRRFMVIFHWRIHLFNTSSLSLIVHVFRLLLEFPYEKRGPCFPGMILHNEPL